MLSIALELAGADVTGIDFLSATPLDSYRCDRAPRGIGFKARYHCICKQRNIRMSDSTQQMCASALALTRQGKPSHVLQRMQYRISQGLGNPNLASA
jgi:hypothetical protein